jgi:peptide/nickel transport system substrate-binding protein
MRRRDLLLSAPLLAAPAIARADAPLRFVPQANLSALDPVWTTATVAINHSLLNYDTLYGLDAQGRQQPQMCEGHEVSADELTWTFTLREGLLFHDGERILARDCVASILRWAVRDSFGQQMVAASHEITAIDDRRFAVRLKKPFRLMLYGLGARYCFMMPERVAKTSAMEQLKDTTGSGPYRFLPKEWVSGASAAYERFDRYVPRQEPPSYFAGGKRANVQRVEWVVQPDPSTAASALQKGEVDWVEQPLIDLAPMLRKTPGIIVQVNDPFGWVSIIALNHLQPPFDNPKVRQALLPAIDQRAFVEAIVGDQADLGLSPVGYFTERHAMATRAGLGVMQGEAGLALSRKLLAESGYKGEVATLIAPSDQPAIFQVAQVTRELFIKIGLKVDFQVIDWGSLVTRRTNQGPADKGGWSAFNTSWGGLTVSNPGSSFPLRSNGLKGPPGWPTDERLEALRATWFDAPDEAGRKAIAEQIQLRALETVPYVPLGQFFQPTAYRTDRLRDMVRCHLPLFWGVTKA